MRIGIKGLGMLVAAVLLAGAAWFSWLVWGQGGSSGKMLNEVRNKAAGGASDTAKQQPLKVVESVQKLKGEYDVIVAGTDPEGVTAAISAARSGLKVLLVDGRNRDILGGLMTIGWLNTLDLNYAPEASMIPGKHNFLNKGYFRNGTIRLRALRSIRIRRRMSFTIWYGMSRISIC
nr:FAD-dependent oxidoreductase [Paenibacillus doosanensis]